MIEEQKQTMNPEESARSTRWDTWTCWGLLMVAFAPLGPQLLGSLFNILYNYYHVRPFLVGDQPAILQNAIQNANLVIYPIAFACWAWAVGSLWRAFRTLVDGQKIEEARLLSVRRRVINLPWWGLLICASAWLACIPAILIPLQRSAEPVDWRVLVHISISIVVGCMIGVTQAFFTVEMASHRMLFPVVFENARPDQTPGAYPLTLRGRGVMWALAAVVCPVACLLLLVVTPHTRGSTPFAIGVAFVAVVFGVISAWMLGQLVSRPVNALRGAAREIASGNLNTNVDVLRADEFGLLISEFNNMVGELREKQEIQAAFGRHVGKQAARQILEQDPDLQGVEREITVMFADLRNFTARCSESTAKNVVEILNLFFADMVEVIEEQHDGMVNKFLGDGFMALFGAGSSIPNHAEQAACAACAMLKQLEALNERLVQLGYQPLEMGIGIHTGPAIVGSIGSTGRGDYTAIGNTVNVASRIESLTKELKVPILMSEQTRAALDSQFVCNEFPPQHVKGKAEPLAVLGLIHIQSTSSIANVATGLSANK